MVLGTLPNKKGKGAKQVLPLFSPPIDAPKSSKKPTPGPHSIDRDTASGHRDCAAELGMASYLATKLECATFSPNSSPVKASSWLSHPTPKSLFCIVVLCYVLVWPNEQSDPPVFGPQT